MWETLEILGRRLELHVDEDHDERLGGVGQRDPVAQREEVFRLAGTGSTDHHGVEPVAAEILGAQDDVLKFPSGFDPHRDHRPARVAPATAVRPQPVDVEATGILDAQSAEQLHTLTTGSGQVARRGRGPSGQRPRISVGRALGEHVRDGEEGVTVAQPALAKLETLTRPAESDALTGAEGQPQDGDPGHSLPPRHRLPLIRSAGVVVDDHPVRTERADRIGDSRRQRRRRT